MLCLLPLAAAAAASMITLWDRNCFFATSAVLILLSVKKARKKAELQQLMCYGASPMIDPSL